MFVLLGNYKGFPDNKKVVPFPEMISMDSFEYMGILSILGA